MKKIDILVFKGCIGSPALTMFEMLEKANMMNAELHGNADKKGLRLRLVACSQDTQIEVSHGCNMRCHTVLREAESADLIVVPAFDGDVLAQLEQNRMVIPWLQRRFEEGADVASICTGAFALAEAGLLNGRAATTHWTAHSLFEERYPDVMLLRQEIIVDEGRLITCGGAFSFLNLIIYLAEKIFGQEVALLASRVMLIDVNKSPQTAYAIFNTQKSHNDAAILKTQKRIEGEFDGELSIDLLASTAALSRRQFQRRFKLATGNTPVEYIQRVRVEAAKKALQATRDSFDEITQHVGYTDSPGFRKIFTRFAGLSPGAFRKRYGFLNTD